MSDQDVKSVSSASAIVPVLKTRSLPAKPVQSAGGNAEPSTGNDVPVAGPSEQDIEALMTKLNVANQSIGRDLRFKVDMNTGRSVIQVLDRETGEIIREIPPEKAAFSVAGNGDLNLRLYDRVV